MSNVMKFCSCRWCKSGKRTKRNKRETKRIMRKFRHDAKQILNKFQDDETLPKSVSIGYTD